MLQQTSLCDLPIEQLKKKLFLVHTLPGLSEDGILKASWGDAGGIRIKEAHYWMLSSEDQRHKHPDISITSTKHASIHMVLNHHVATNLCGYHLKPFTVIIPVYQEKQEDDPLKQVVAACVSEIVMVGDYKLPKNTVIIVRKDKAADIPEYYKTNNFNIHIYEDQNAVYLSDPNSTPITEISEKVYHNKIDTVNKVVTSLGGERISLHASTSPFACVPDQSVQNINTAEFFKKLLPNQTASFGSDEMEHPHSKGQQWRVARSRYDYSGAFYGEVGCFMELYHAQKAREWFLTFDLPITTKRQWLRVQRNNLIARRAMDLIYGHTQNKFLAQKYLYEHLLNGEYNNKFKEITANIYSSEDFSIDVNVIDDLAKSLVDMQYLKIQSQGAFNLATVQEVVDLLICDSDTMKPDEAKLYFEQYFKNSNIFNSFPVNEQKFISKQVENSYAFFFINNPYITKEEINKYEEELITIINTDYDTNSASISDTAKFLWLYKLPPIYKKALEEKETIIQQLNQNINNEFQELMENSSGTPHAVAQYEEFMSEQKKSLLDVVIDSMLTDYKQLLRKCKVI